MLSYLKPYRGRVALAILFSFLVAALTSLSLSTLIPILETLFEAGGLETFRNGIRISVITVANKMPKPSEMAIGTMNCADDDFSNSNGISPKNVVRDVSMTGRNLTTPARSTAANNFSPVLRWRWLMKSTSTRLSLITTPVSAIRPSMLRIVSVWPINQWPNTAPITPNGIIDITSNGCT